MRSGAQESLWEKIALQKRAKRVRTVCSETSELPHLRVGGERARVFVAQTLCTLLRIHTKCEEALAFQTFTLRTSAHKECEKEMLSRQHFAN
jgi:hypothetical protein